VFETVLVADRGVTALRVVRTCERLGVQAVAVHADDDARSPHVRAADEAVPLGGSGVHETYGDRRKVLEAARRSGAQGVHPGAGVLALDESFARAVLDAGLAWLGPPPDLLARGARPPSGVGGRRVTVVLAQDGAVLGLRDGLGGSMGLLDEAPAPGLTAAAATRAVEAASGFADGSRALQAVDVVLQDESAAAVAAAPLAAPGLTATEAVSGVDVVAAQLRLAAGDRPERNGSDRAGHAVALHLRVAEHFAGRLRRCRLLDDDTPGITTDTAVAEGDRLTAQSARLLALVTVRGRDRQDALTLARAAVGAVEVAGVPTNLPVLRAVLEDAAYLAGGPDSALVERIRRS
jgi:acetyl/propionyl-CoA carboxylase alpha subunit